MSKSAKKTKKETTSKKPKKMGKSLESQSKAEEYVGYLLELHKLQGVLLNRLHREV